MKKIVPTFEEFLIEGKEQKDQKDYIKKMIKEVSKLSDDDINSIMRKESEYDQNYIKAVESEMSKRDKK